MSTNATLLSMSTTEQIYLSSYYTSILKRLLIVFGSICFLWLLLGLIFASIQTYRHFKKRTYQKFIRSIPPPLPPIEQMIKEDNISDDDDNDDQTSVFTSISFLSERSKNIHEHTHFVPPCQRIPEEEFELTLPISPGISNMAYSQSTLSSSNDGGPSLLYYPGCRNFAYSQSTLASSVDLNTPTPSIILPSPTKPLLTRFVNLKRHSSQSSTNTTFSQITNATYLSSSSASTSSSNPTTSIKTIPLPTLMITDCDRLQTDIIELEDFEPEKDWRRARPELRLLLNDRMPQAVR
jgi:hypothetical protein